MRPGVVAVLAAAIWGGVSATFSRDPAPLLDYGGAMIAGGYYSSGENDWFEDVEVINGEPLPDLPAAISGSTLTLLGSVLYSCGGNYDNFHRPYDQCYTLDTSSTSLEWSKNVTLPVPMNFQTASAVGSHIWFLYHSVLYDLNTQTSEFVTYSLPFIVNIFHCAVSDDRHTYAIGVGPNDDEIWINIKSGDPEFWEKRATMPDSRQHHACLLYGSLIFISGGLGTEGSVSVFDAESGAFHYVEPLNTPRMRHGMFVFEGRPAVVGGSSETDQYFKSIESFNATTQSWLTEDRQLTHEKNNFGIAQFSF